MLVVIKGAGDLASGVAVRLFAAGFRVVMTDLPCPTTIRRTVAFSPAVTAGASEVEGIRGVFARDAQTALSLLREGCIPVLADPNADCIGILKPRVVVDAILAKRNTQTRLSDAPIVVALGPGFCAGEDCHAVVETQRGHFLGRVYYAGGAIPNTGVPGDIGGYTAERILRAPCAGVFEPLAQIGAQVSAGDVVARVDGVPIRAQIGGMVRGMLPAGIRVWQGMKSGDIDPRCEKSHCFSVSDKARSIGGGVLESILHLSGGAALKEEFAWKTQSG